MAPTKYFKFQIAKPYPAVHKGGIRAVDNSDAVGILHCFAVCRLQSLAKVTDQADPTKLATLTFEAMLLAIENIAPSPALHHGHVTLRGLSAKHSGTLAPEQI